MSEKAVFIDRDGTISQEVGYVNHIDRFRLLPRTADAIKALNDNKLKAVVVTNQAGVARGYFPEELIGEVHQKMETLVGEKGGQFDGIYYCPHHPTAGEPPYRQKCNCRKPGTGMIDKAVEDLGVDPTQSYMIGDKIGDVELGKRVGGKGILVLTGYGKGELKYFKQEWTVEPDYVAEDLYDAVQWILEDQKG